MMQNKFVAYAGEKFFVEWYFDAQGKSPALKYYENLPVHQKEKLFYLFYTLADTGKIHSEEKFRHEGDQIYAFKPIPDRFLCFFYQGSKIIVTNAFEKKTNKMPVQEKQKALRAKADFVKRYAGGTYYE